MIYGMLAKYVQPTALTMILFSNGKAGCHMIRLENHRGTIDMSQEYFASLVGNAVSSCFGVAGMRKANARQGLRSLISKQDYIDKGVRVRAEDKQLLIDLHITVMHGINISAITKSIVNKVRYTVEAATGITVKRVNVYVDGMNA